MATTRTASTSARKGAATRASRKTPAAAGAAQHANAQNLSAADKLVQEAKNVQQPGNPNTAAPAGAQGNGDNKPQTNDAHLVVPHIQHAALVDAIKGASAGFKAAVSLEVAVICAVFIDLGSTDVRAKKELYSVYKDAGYDCDVGGKGRDYKTVNRRIGYGQKFFESLPADELKNAVGDARDAAAIQNLLVHINSKYALKSMSDVLTAAGVEPQTRPRLTNTGNGGGGQQGGAGGAPQGGGAAQTGQQGQPVFASTGAANPVTTGGSQPDAGDRGVMAAMGQQAEQRAAEGQNRREFDDTSKWVKFTFEGATVVIPIDMKVECLSDLGLKLAHAASQMRGAKVDVATLNAEFKEMAAAAH